MKVLEYMAMGKPVIATNIPAHRELIQNNITGLLTKCDENDFAKKIIYLLSNFNEAKIMGKEARKFVENKFSLEIIGLKYENFLKKLLME